MPFGYDGPNYYGEGQDGGSGYEGGDLVTLLMGAAATSEEEARRRWGITQAYYLDLLEENRRASMDAANRSNAQFAAQLAAQKAELEAKLQQASEALEQLERAESNRASGYYRPGLQRNAGPRPKPDFPTYNAPPVTMPAARAAMPPMPQVPRAQMQTPPGHQWLGAQGMPPAMFGPAGQPGGAIQWDEMTPRLPGMGGPDNPVADYARASGIDPFGEVTGGLNSLMDPENTEWRPYHTTDWKGGEHTANAIWDRRSEDWFRPSMSPEQFQQNYWGAPPPIPGQGGILPGEMEQDPDDGTWWRLLDGDGSHEEDWEQVFE